MRNYLHHVQLLQGRRSHQDRRWHRKAHGHPGDQQYQQVQVHPKKQPKGYSSLLVLHYIVGKALVPPVSLYDYLTDYYLSIL